MKKIAFVVQRYGTEVNGGAEYHCRILAERLTHLYEVSVLTSCAMDYVTWANDYPAGESELKGVKIIRFPTLHNRENKLFDTMTRKLKKESKPEKKNWLARLKKRSGLSSTQSTEHDNYLWAKYQGPYMPEFITYLKGNHNKYDVLIFFTYLYYPTLEGLKIAPRKSILIPTAHDEPPIYLPVFKNLFSLPKAILYNSLSEQRFVNRTFHNESIYSDLVGVGIESGQEMIEHSAADLIGTESPYLIYIGRIDSAKGCAILFDYFTRYTEKASLSLKLVMVGQAFMSIPTHPDIISMGFVDEAVKVALLKGAKALVVPSLYESLSMVTLESFSYGIPVIANANCEVLNDHIETSKAGFAYRDYPDFEKAVDQVLSQDVSKMAENAHAYIDQNYTWKAVLAKFAKAVDYVGKR